MLAYFILLFIPRVGEEEEVQFKDGLLELGLVRSQSVPLGSIGELVPAASLVTE